MSPTKPTTSRGTAVFAQRVDAPRPPLPLTEERHFSSGLALFFVPTVTCALLLVFARPNNAQNLPDGAHPPTTSAARAKLASEGAQDAVGAKAADGTSRRPLSFYTEVVRGNMFSPPQPAPPPIPVVVKTPKPVLVKVPVAEVDPFADWSYTGTIRQGDQLTALLENTKTKDGQYVHPGDSFLGAQVESVTDQDVTLKSGGKPHMLAKSDTITVTPLDKSAAYLTATPTPTPGAPGMPGMPGMPGPAPDGSITLPNGRVISAQRYQRMQQRMNQRFNGGGGGGGYGGGGGRRGGGGGFGGGGFGG